MQHQLILFESADGNISVEVKLENETVWLTQKQIAKLFDKSIKTISEHINNIFRDTELIENEVIRKSQITAPDGKIYETNIYNLDVIISVGYRIKSKRGIEFRRWANSILKDYLLKGYAFNRNVIDTATQEYQNLIALLSNTLINSKAVDKQGQNIIALISDYASTWTTLLRYDEGRLTLPSKLHTTSITIEYNKAITAIAELKQKLMSINEATLLFGNELNNHLQSILANLNQSMFNEELYKREFDNKYSWKSLCQLNYITTGSKIW